MADLPENEIKELFGGCGEVLSFRLVIDKETGRGKGFGFVEFPNIGMKTYQPVLKRKAYALYRECGDRCAESK